MGYSPCGHRELDTTDELARSLQKREGHGPYPVPLVESACFTSVEQGLPWRPVAKTPHFRYWGPGFDPGSRNWIPQAAPRPRAAKISR